MNQAGLPLLPGFAARLLEKWASKRIRHRGRDTILDYNHLYILPTRHGITFFISLLIILLAAINYEISLGYMLVFLLTAIGFLGIIHTHINLNHLKVSITNAPAVFAGQNAEFPISITALKNKNHFGIILQSDVGLVAKTDINESTNNVIASLPVKTSQRGRLKLKRIKIYSEYPFGLFHVWSWLELDAQCMVYPHPVPYTLRNHGHHKLTGTKVTNENGYDDFAGIRKYQKGDAPNHLAWKAIARSGELQTKYYAAETSPIQLISWYQLPDSMDIEQRLSILCYQVIEADNHGALYGLKLPGMEIKPSSGLHHRHHCLQTLAMFGNSNHG